MRINRDIVAVAMIVLVGVFYYLVTLNSPVVFGDEGHYAAAGRYMAETGEYPVYQPYYGTDVYHLTFNRQPLFYFLNAGAWLIAGEFGVKALLPIFSLLSALMLYLLFRSVNKPDYGIAAAFILLMLPGMVTYGVLDYVETANVLFITAALYFGYHGLDTGKKEQLLASGAFLGLGLITELTAAVVPIVFVLWFLSLKKFGRWKDLALIFAAAAFIMAPYLARNLILYGGFCYAYLPGVCNPIIDGTIPHNVALDFASTISQTGTNLGILKIGLLNYFRFAWGWTATIALLFGVVFAFAKRDKLADLLLVWLLVFLAMTAYLGVSGSRAEDLPRFTLFGFPALAAVGALFVGDSFEWFKKKGGAFVAVAVIIAVFFTIAFWTYGGEKLNTMVSVKAFAPGFFDGCKWIKANTPSDALLFTIYSHHTAYQCDRKNIGVLPDSAEIQLTNNETSYQHLKLHGFDYVYVQMFTVSDEAIGEGITNAFLNYLSTSPHFNLVFDNTATYSNGGVKVFKVL